jgi:hypothetical protein
VGVESLTAGQTPGRALDRSSACRKCKKKSMAKSVESLSQTLSAMIFRQNVVAFLAKETLKDFPIIAGSSLSLET